MQGTPNAERLMRTARLVFDIDKKSHNKAYSICMDMKLVYANAIEEQKVLFKKLKQAGIKPLNHR